MQFDGITFRGPPLDAGAAEVTDLPANLVNLLRQINGFIMFHGGLHVRGVCAAPEWHSLSSVTAGPGALLAHYPALLSTDVPFAQDCVADQFILRDGVVHKLESETGHLASLDLSLSAFFGAVQADPVEFLAMQPLLRHQQDGGVLQPGQVLHVYPPFCTREAADGVSLRAVPVSEALAFLADFSRQIAAGAK